MKSFGQILINARKAKNLSLEEVEAATKIRKKILEALEAGDWNALPPTTFVKGLIKNYGRFLGLNTNELLAFYRREFIEKKEHKEPTVPINKNPWRFTPQRVTAGVIGLIVLAVIAYLFFQYQSFIGPPLLELSEPKNNIKLTSSEVTLVGKTWEDAILKVNGQPVTVSPGGTFSVAVDLNPGLNTLTVTAANRFGKISTEKRTIVVDLANQQKQTEPAANVKLTIKAGPDSTNLLVEVDGQTKFDGVLVAGSEKDFSATERIRIVTKNAGSTQVIYNGNTETLGDPNQQVEKVYPPEQQTPQ